MMKKAGGLLSLVLLGVLILGGVLLFNNISGVDAASFNIGFVDMEKLQKELPDYQNLQQIIRDKESEYNLFRGYIYQEHQSSVKDLERKINQTKSGKSKEEQEALDKKLQGEIKKKTDELNARLSEKVAEIQKYLKEQEQIIWDKVQKLISEVASDKKVEVVLEKKSVYHGGKDITQDVITKAKKQAEQESKDSKSESKSVNK